MIAALGVIGLVVGLVMLQALVIMLVWGAIAGIFDGPTIGYGMSFLVSIALGLVGGIFKRAS